VNADRRVVALFSATMLTSAILLFAVQPMVARFVLPTFGSAPQVWAVALVFFQAALLLGYLYAHLSSSRLGLRRALTLHGVLLVLPALTLPLAVPAVDADVSAGNPAWALLSLLAISVGLPFFVVSSTAPLLQRWLVHTKHPAGRDPYFLYRASNFGSVLGLLSYPLLFEPRLTLDAQGLLWTWGYVLLAVLLVGCGAFVWRSSGGATRPAAVGPDDVITARRRLTWLVLAAVPSGLIVAATTVLTTDVAPIPLLWVLPLGLYLVTFMLAFSSGGRARRVYTASVWLMPVAILAVAVVTVAEIRSPLWLILSVHLLAVFTVAMVCHGRLAQDRPSPQRLTTFYLVESTGGVLGGAFAALLAPLIFDSLWEYPLALALAALLWPGVRRAKPLGVGDLAWPVALGVVVYVALTQSGDENLVLIVGVAVCALFALRRPARLAAGLAALFIAGTAGLAAEGTPVIERERNFFGVRTVEQSADVRSLVHGTTLHGNQLLDPGLPQPTTYYHPASPIAQLLTGGPRGLTRRTAVVGLGTGTMAAYSQPGDRWTFYEIDPEIVRVARDPKYFTYLRDAPGATDIVVGDARLSLQDVRDGTFSLIVADAFSSDAIPTHLITREALALYFRKLGPGGVLAFHISNRYIDLEPVLGNLARDAGLGCFYGNVDAPLGVAITEASASVWVALARDPGDLGEVTESERWRRCATGPDSRTWTDDYSNIISVLR
jgi:SAM-dependent methyltransferase